MVIQIPRWGWVYPSVYHQTYPNKQRSISSWPTRHRPRSHPGTTPQKVNMDGCKKKAGIDSLEYRVWNAADLPSLPFLCLLSSKRYQPPIQLVRLRLCFQNIKQVWRTCLVPACLDMLVPLEDCWQSTPLWTGAGWPFSKHSQLMPRGLYQGRSEGKGDPMVCLTDILVRVITNLPRTWKALQGGVRASPGSGQTPCSYLDVSLLVQSPSTIGSIFSTEVVTMPGLNQIGHYGFFLTVSIS